MDGQIYEVRRPMKSAEKCGKLDQEVLPLGLKGAKKRLIFVHIVCVPLSVIVVKIVPRIAWARGRTIK